MTRRDVPSQRMTSRARLTVVPERDDWPEDLEPVLVDARTAYLSAAPPEPSPEVLAFLEEPAHGKVAADWRPWMADDPEPMDLDLLAPPAPRARRHLVALAGAAAAVALVAVGLQAALSSSPEQETTPLAATSAPTAPSTTTPAPEFEPSAGGSSVDWRADEVPWASSPPTTAGPPAAAAAPAPLTATTAAPARRKPAIRPRPAPTTVAPPTARELTLAYFEAAYSRGRCVARQPKESSRADLVEACGPEPVPPDNLVQYWAAKTTWLDCAQPMIDQGRSSARIEAECGARPRRAAYDVPPNPYSATT